MKRHSTENLDMESRKHALPRSAFDDELKLGPFVMCWRSLIMDKRLPWHLKGIYLYIGARCMGEQKETWVSLQTIARDMGYKSRGAVHKYLQQLKDLGMISSRNEYDKRRGITRTYYTRVHPYKVWGDDWYKPWDAYWETDEDGGPLDPGLEVDEEGIPIDHVFPEETDCSPPESDIDLSQRAASSPGESAQGEEFNKKNLSNLSNEDVAQILPEGEPEPSVDPSPINGKEKVGFNKLDILRGGFSKKEAPTDIRKDRKSVV